MEKELDLLSKHYKEDRQVRWRLVLGDDDQKQAPLEGDALQIDQVLGALYDSPSKGKKRRGDLSASAPRVARWLGDIREYFPSTVVRVLQNDALEKFNLHQLMLEPEMLEAIEPDVNLLANLISLKDVIPAHSKETARQIVQKLVDELMQKIQSSMEQAVRGALNRAQTTRRPRANDINWGKTIRSNLKNYQQEYQTVIPDHLLGFGRKSQGLLQDIVLCVDQSGSMASSVVYASIFAAVLASIRSIATQLIVFDTAVVDLTEKLADPVDVLFGTQLGGGTDIDQAVAYSASKITRPEKTTMVLITDLYEGGNEKQLIQRVAALVESGVNLITLLALNDDGAPSYDHQLAKTFSQLNIPVFACTPDLFPDLMASALQRQDITEWTAKHDVVIQS